MLQEYAFPETWTDLLSFDGTDTVLDLVLLVEGKVYSWRFIC